MGRIAAVQINSTDSVEQNLSAAEKWIKKATEQGAKLVVLPEDIAFIGRQATDKLLIAEEPGQGPIQAWMANIAKQYKIWLVGGTIPIIAPSIESGKRVFGCCFVWNSSGQIVGRYDKIHLFDVEVREGEHYRESATIFPGNDIVCIETPVGKIGLSICYDVRFPELYRALLQQGAEILLIPSAFTAITGEAHWEIVVRARAIENLCYVIAPNQVGIHANGRASFGHSMIVDPWGKIVSNIEANVGTIVADIDLNYLADVRARFPTIQHRKIF